MMTAPVRMPREAGTGGKHAISRIAEALAKIRMCLYMRSTQLNRSVETRSGPNDVKQSTQDTGSIEGADNVIIIHRPEKYGLLKTPYGNSTKGIAEIICRQGKKRTYTDLQCSLRDDLARFLKTWILSCSY
jgi:replicative DNA helicase